MRLFLIAVTTFAFAATSFGQPPRSFSQVLGLQTFDASYGFTDDTRLVETARVIAGMGGQTIKFSLGSHAYGHDYGKDQKYESLTGLCAKDPSIQQVFKMPFRHYILWAYPLAQQNDTVWLDGLNEEEKQIEQREIYELSCWILKNFSGSGKSFLLGHWEGDWYLYQGLDPAKTQPDEDRTTAMTEWLNARQAVIDKAKRDIPHKNVYLWHYTEANLVRRAMEGKRSVANTVLPNSNVDYVSYSAWDSLGDGDVSVELPKALDYLESKLPVKPQGGPPGKRVFVGEFGFPLVRVANAQEQSTLARKTARAAVAWGCPYALYWQVYCNEQDDSAKNGYRGFWLVNHKGKKQPAYYWMRDYFQWANGYRAGAGADFRQDDFLKAATRRLDR